MSDERSACVASSQADAYAEPSGDRRSLRRDTVSALAAVSRGTQKDAAHVDNLTVDGARLRGCTGEPLAVGQRLMLQVAVATVDHIITMQATVRWIADGDPSSGGVVFDPSLSSEDALAIVHATDPR
jgi:hypothetical protein